MLSALHHVLTLFGVFTITAHMREDLGFWVFFLAGQALYLLKRASMAMRSGKLVSRQEYVTRNWDIILIRSAFEFPIFWVWRHYSIVQIMGFFSVQLPVTGIPDSPLTAFVIGFCADAILDWVSTSDKLPAFLRDWLQEQIPELPPNGTSGIH